MQVLHAESLDGALGFELASVCESLARGDAGVLANTLGPVGRDHEVQLATLSCETMQERADDAFVVGVREDGHHGWIRRLDLKQEGGREDCDHAGKALSKRTISQSAATANGQVVSHRR